MAVEEYTWDAQIGAGPIKYSDTVRAAQYGDGYEQVAEQGINSTMIEVPLLHIAQTTEANEVKAFLLRHTVKAFIFTPPGDVKGLYRVDATSITDESLSQHVRRLSWTVKRAYGVFA